MKAGTGWIARFLGGRALPSSNRVASEPERPRRVSIDRVGTFLTQRGYRFRVDDTGDITGVWEGHRFWFLLLGDDRNVLQVRGCWAEPLSPPNRLTALQAVNDWNRERIWPKVYVREEAEGLAVYAEVSVDLEHGATDDQLGQVVSCGLGTGVQLFSALKAMLPGVDPTD